MESQWLIIDESEELEQKEPSGPLLGIFRRDPAHIALLELPRPITPFSFNIHTTPNGFKDNLCEAKDEAYGSAIGESGIESPVVSRRGSKTHIQSIPLISVF